MDDHVPVRCKPSTQAHYRRMVDSIIVPALGRLPVEGAQRSEIAKFHHGLRATPYQANRALGVLSKMFALAEVWGWRADGTNPCRHIKPYKERNRERFLSEEEMTRLGEVLRKAEREMPSAVAAFRLLLLTGCRMSEIQKLRWEFVKRDCIELPDSKTGGRVVPLSPDAHAVLSSIPREEGNPWVIAGRFPGSHISNLQRPWTIIRERAGLDDVRIHDLRTPSLTCSCSRRELADDGVVEEPDFGARRVQYQAAVVGSQFGVCGHDGRTAEASRRLETPRWPTEWQEERWRAA